MTEPTLSSDLTDAALRLAGIYPEEWLCPTCGEVVADELVRGDRPPVHEHYGHPIEFVERAQL
jgi:hypothetical protein